MRLKTHGAFLFDFVRSFVEGEFDRWEFDLDYSGYIIEHFPAFQAETPRLAARFVDTVDYAYDFASPLADEPFREAIAYALDVFRQGCKPTVFL